MIKNIIKGLFYGSCILFVSWFVISYLDIVLFNLEGGSSSHWWNLFNL